MAVSVLFCHGLLSDCVYLSTLLSFVHPSSFKLMHSCGETIWAVRMPGANAVCSYTHWDWCYCQLKLLLLLLRRCAAASWPQTQAHLWTHFRFLLYPSHLSCLSSGAREARERVEEACVAWGWWREEVAPCSSGVSICTGVPVSTHFCTSKASKVRTRRAGSQTL